MASGANSTPLGRFVPRAPAGAATSSLLKPPATGRASRFSDTPNPLPPAAAAAPPPPVERKSGFSARNFTLVEDGENMRASRFTSKINNGTCLLDEVENLVRTALAQHSVQQLIAWLTNK